MGEYSADKAEIARYLGFRGNRPDAGTAALIDEATALLARTARPRYLYRFFPLQEQESGVALLGAGLCLLGQDIKKHLTGCERCVVLAATLGLEVDRALGAMQLRDMAKAVVLDCAATALIESVCNAAEREIQNDERARGQYLSWRFSPGYGDLPIDCQRELCAVIDATRKIGLAATPENILTPQKSVTAILGISSSPLLRARESCESCNLKDSCQMRKEGAHCAD